MSRKEDEISRLKSLLRKKNKQIQKLKEIVEDEKYLLEQKFGVPKK